MKGQIKLCYRKVIDSGASVSWEKRVLKDTFRELYMQAQQFDPNGHYKSYAELKSGIPQIDQLNYLVSTAASGYLQALNGFMPDILDKVGKLCVPFKNYQFEIIQSDLSDQSQHAIAITFYSEWLTWIDTLGSEILFCDGDGQIDIIKGEEVSTHMVSFRDGFQIALFKAK